MELISSLSNAKIKQVRSLRQRKGRRESGLFLAEGIRHVGEAVAAAEHGAPGPGSPVSVEAIFYAPDLLTSKYAGQLIQEQSQRGVPCYPTSVEVFHSITDKENPAGILAIVRPGRAELSDLEPGNFPWGVALVSPQDPGNIGAILRTINAVGASGLLLLEDSADPYYPSAVRASMGALFWHPVCQASFADFVRWARDHGYHIYGTSARGRRDYREVAGYPRPVILLMGSEREGLTPEQAKVCDEMVRLPMLGRATSLNLAVATGIMLYAMLVE